MIHLKASSNVFVSQGGRLSVDVLSRRVITTTMSGNFDLGLAQHFLESLDAWVKLGATNLLAYHDWERVDDYDPKARELVTPWSKLHRPKFDAVHILLKNRALALGVQIVNHVTGDVMTAHFKRKDFEQARREALGSSARGI